MKTSITINLFGTLYAIDDFKSDWESVYGDKKIPDLLG